MIVPRAYLDTRPRPCGATERAVVLPGAITLLAWVLLGLCLGLVLVTLVLPLLLWSAVLGFAALTAAWLVPPLARLLRRHARLAVYLDAAAGWRRLAWRGRLRVLGWLTVRFMFDGCRVLIIAVVRLFGLAARARP